MEVRGLVGGGGCVEGGGTMGRLTGPAAVAWKGQCREAGMMAATCKNAFLLCEGCGLYVCGLVVSCVF